MEDLISRKAVLNLTKELRFNSVKGMEDYCYRCIDPNEVEELPPIQPHVYQWIEHIDRDDYDDSEELWYECPCCNGKHYRDSKYCPDCGAKMEVE